MENPSLSSNDDIFDIRSSSYTTLSYRQLPYTAAISFNSFEFLLTLAQIVIAILVLKGTKGDFPEEKWIIAYVSACCLNVLILCWGFWQIIDPSQLRIHQVMACLSAIIDSFFAVWTLVFLFVFIFSSSNLDHSSKLFQLCVAFLVIGGIRYVLALVIFVALCCCGCCAMSLAVCFTAAN